MQKLEVGIKNKMNSRFLFISCEMKSNVTGFFMGHLIVGILSFRDISIIKLGPKKIFKFRDAPD